ncbi:glycosyltransferase family 4 protein [Listeria weihenstephanensis]|uniref:Glycosyltransferase family 4 protein n=1 Tax=Listeria weihenstephanensis TaxID=1006155 RepID=A0A841Z3E1_9LIST|nr:glycosyltransferase family 4 protein [Listeria weihenstephanensis]MBC1499192.1 glycosyltransferase family 4 protein [Listeria weihenstephanensis]
MKKVLLISQNFYPEIGSAANRMKYVFQTLSMTHQVTLITTEPGYPNQNLYREDQFWEEQLDEKDVIRIKVRTKNYTRNIMKRFLFYLEIMLQFIRAILKQKKTVDVIYISTPPISVGIAGLFAKSFLKARLIVEVRDLWPEALVGINRWNKPWLLRLAYMLEKRIYRRADEIIVNSEGFVDYIVGKGIAKEKIHFVPNSLTERELKVGAKLKKEHLKEEYTVIYAGNIGLAQEMEDFFDMAERFQKDPKVQFKIFGYGFRLEEAKKQLLDRNLTNITILCPQNRSFVLEEIKKADIAYVTLVDHPVFETVLPGKIIDYMGMGIPIIGNVSGYSDEVIRNAGCGYTYQHGETDAMCARLKQLMENATLCSQLGKNGHAYVCENHRWATNFQRIEGIVNRG